MATPKEPPPLPPRTRRQSSVNSDDSQTEYIVRSELNQNYNEQHLTTAYPTSPRAMQQGPVPDLNRRMSVDSQLPALLSTQASRNRPYECVTPSMPGSHNVSEGSRVDTAAASAMPGGVTDNVQNDSRRVPSWYWGDISR